MTAIRDWIGEHGYPPTIRELGQRLGIKSLRGVTTHLDAIVKKGFLSRRRGARGLRLLNETPATATQAVRLPIIGRIAAGQPIFAEQSVEGQLSVDASALGAGGRHFALQVRGASMTSAGILDGDYVIVREQPDADSGDIVAALVGEEATVKRLFKEEGRIRLQPEHPDMEPLLVQAGTPMAVLGKVIAVFRKLS